VLLQFRRPSLIDTSGGNDQEALAVPCEDFLRPVVDRNFCLPGPHAHQERERLRLPQEFSDGDLVLVWLEDWNKFHMGGNFGPMLGKSKMEVYILSEPPHILPAVPTVVGLGLPG